MNPVGILGGMGPEATILLMQKVLAAVPVKDDADHVPLIVHQNPQVPSRIRALIEGTGKDPGPVIAKMARDLQAAGAQALAMPCNTAHHYAGALPEDLPFLNMIDLTGAALAGKRVGMLASPAVRQVGVFEATFEENGIDAIYPDDDSPVLAIIRAVKAGQGGDVHALADIAEDLMQSADHICLACTELSLLARDLPNRIPWTDSLDCLTDRIIDFART
ncbi:MAG: amino acid racemase [Pseudomonadota bacterium]